MPDTDYRGLLVETFCRDCTAVQFMDFKGKRA